MFETALVVLIVVSPPLLGSPNKRKWLEMGASQAVPLARAKSRQPNHMDSALRASRSLVIRNGRSPTEN
jgi:hypothetical protein